MNFGMKSTLIQYILHLETGNVVHGIYFCILLTIQRHSQLGIHV